MFKEIMKMSFVRIMVLVILLYDMGFGKSADEEDIRQDGAKVLYVNPKYFESINFITLRKGRNSPYLTFGNATTIDPLGNNVTVVMQCFNAKNKRDIFTLDYKVCEILKLSWTKEWLKQYSNVVLQCPVPPGIYMFSEIQLPPRNFPVHIPVGDYGILISFIITKTKEKMLDIRVNLRIATKKRAHFL